MTDHTQLRQAATEALHWDFHCDNPDCGCSDSMSAFAEKATPKAIIELLDEIERLKQVFRVNMLRAFPEKSHNEITAEIEKALK